MEAKEMVRHDTFEEMKAIRIFAKNGKRYYSLECTCGDLTEREIRSGDILTCSHCAKKYSIVLY